MSRRGRKRLFRKREPNGRSQRLVQRDLEDEARQVAHSARERVYGLACATARLPEVVDPLGRAFVKGIITQSELEAGREYEKLHRQWLKVALVRTLGSSVDFNRASGYDADEGDNPEYVEHCQHVTDRINGSRRALVKAGRLSQIAVDTWCIEQQAAWGLVPPLRLGLWSLVSLYRINSWLSA